MRIGVCLLAGSMLVTACGERRSNAPVPNASPEAQHQQVSFDGIPLAGDAAVAKLAGFKDCSGTDKFLDCKRPDGQMLFGIPVKMVSVHFEIKGNATGLDSLRFAGVKYEFESRRDPKTCPGYKSRRNDEWADVLPNGCNQYVDEVAVELQKNGFHRLPGHRTIEMVNLQQGVKASRTFRDSYVLFTPAADSDREALAEARARSEAERRASEAARSLVEQMAK